MASCLVIPCDLEEKEEEEEEQEKEEGEEGGVMGGWSTPPPNSTPLHSIPLPAATPLRISGWDGPRANSGKSGQRKKSSKGAGGVLQPVNAHQGAASCLFIPCGMEWEGEEEEEEEEEGKEAGVRGGGNAAHECGFVPGHTY